MQERCNNGMQYAPKFSTFSEIFLHDILTGIRCCRECVTSWFNTGARLVSAPARNPLTLYCDHFDRGADHS